MSNLKHLLLAVLVALGSLQAATVIRQDTFANALNGWQTPNYWAGKTEWVATADQPSQKVLRITSGNRGQEVFGRTLAHIRQTDYTAGMEISLRIRLRGTGKFEPGILLYHFEDPNKILYHRAGVRTLPDDFTWMEWRVVIPYRLKSILPFMEVTGQGTAEISHFVLESVTLDGASITTDLPMQVIPEGGTVPPVTFRSTLPNREITVCTHSDESVREERITSKSDGSFTVTPKLPAGLSDLAASAATASAKIYVDVCPVDDFKAMEALAAKTSFKGSILIIGDSLSDFYRGYNYLDRLNFWLNRRAPGSVTIHNAGIGGDYITRVNDRFEGLATKTRKAHRQEMYDGIFDRHYDLVLIFLGQNDTRCLRSQNYSTPLIPPELQLTAYRQLIQTVRKHTDARIALISPSPSYIQAYYDREKKTPPEKEFYLYGKKEFVDGFDQTNRQLCRELNLGYIDILNPMRNAPDTKALYVADGCHLATPGGRLVARVILQWLATEYTKENHE